MRILVTGGAGYIGSVVVEKLLERQHKVVVVDNLQTGYREAVDPDAEFIQADLNNQGTLDSIFQMHSVEAVVHLAADSIVETSMSDPGRFFRNNVVGGINLLSAMLQHDVFKVIFSSSAAVYGMPQKTPITEDEEKLPINAYGETKLIFERIMAWYEKSHKLRHISLRYFNAAGASVLHGEAHRPETHLIPNVLNATNDAKTVSVFGTDYPTKDGTCIRDYVHVIDIANAHILALEKIDSIGSGVFNLGNGKGYSVSEIIESAQKVTGTHILRKDFPRRPGDPAELVASSDRARNELGWNPVYSNIETIIETAWKWFRSHPTGYTG